MVMNRPTRGGKHQIPSLPLIHLAFDRGPSRSREIIIHCSGRMPMRSVDDLGRADRHGGEEVRGRAVGTPCHRIVEQVQTPTNIVLAKRLKLIKMLLYLLP